MSNSLKLIIGWAVTGLYTIVTANFVGNQAGSEVCKKVEISLTDTTNRMVVPRDITKLMEDKNNSAFGHPFSGINKLKIAKIIEENIAQVKEVGVYRAIDGTICINIKQRNPLLRIINQYNQSYYIDTDEYVVPMSQHWSPRIIAANGEIPEQLYTNRAIPLDSIYEKIDYRYHILKELYTLASYISKDELLKAQIEQIYVSNNEYELIAKVGTHVIYFGKADNIETKFFNLKTIYHKGFANLGWQKYKAINLKYSNQVICTKR